MPTKTPTSAPMSPAQAAQMKGVSRRTIMRAIEMHELKAFRDNRNHWKIDPQELDMWAGAQWAPTGHAHLDVPALPSPDLAILLARVEAERDALREQLEQIKDDRDHWRKMAERQQNVLTEQRPRGFLARLFRS
jgi:excisionase family DNA binding protein